MIKDQKEEDNLFYASLVNIYTFNFCMLQPSLPKADLELLSEMLLLVDEKKYNDVMKNILTEDLTQGNNNNNNNSTSKKSN